MDQTTATTRGLRPSPRQLWIFGLYAATVLGACAALPALKARAGGYNLVPILLILSPWLLGLLVIVLDRPGPLRNWMAPLLLSLFYPSIALWYDVAALVDWARLGQPPFWAFAAFLNALFLGGFAAYVASMYPRRCPRCARRALIPLLRLGKQEKRTSKTRWCASCDARLWRDDRGEWHAERRQTWLDTAGGPAPAAATAPHFGDPAPAGSKEMACCNDA